MDFRSDLCNSRVINNIYARGSCCMGVSKYHHRTRKYHRIQKLIIQRSNICIDDMRENVVWYGSISILLRTGAGIDFTHSQ